MNWTHRMRAAARASVLASVVLCCLGMVSPAWSADTGSIRVTLYHADGSPLEDAQVTLRSGRDGPMIRNVLTCDDSLVLFENLEPGIYDVRIAKDGYGTVALPGIEVPAGRRVAVPITLRLMNGPPVCGGIGTLPKPEPAPRSGSVRVEVREIDGGLMQNALVTLHASRDGPVLREAPTSEDGLALFEDLEPTEYVVGAAKRGYGTLVTPGVTVVDGYRFPLRLTLRRADSPRPCGPQPVAP